MGLSQSQPGPISDRGGKWRVVNDLWGNPARESVTTVGQAEVTQKMLVLHKRQQSINC